MHLSWSGVKIPSQLNVRGSNITAAYDPTVLISNVCVFPGGQGFQSASDPDSSNAIDGSKAAGPVVTISTVVVSAVLSAVLAVLCSVVIVLSVRYARRRCGGGSSGNKSPQESSPSSSRFPGYRPSSNSRRGGDVDNFGFSTVSSKFSHGRPALDDLDLESTASSSTLDNASSSIDMNY